jgi:hypothetical protein
MHAHRRDFSASAAILANGTYFVDTPHNFMVNIYSTGFQVPTAVTEEYHLLDVSLRSPVVVQHFSG